MKIQLSRCTVNRATYLLLVFSIYFNLKGQNYETLDANLIKVGVNKNGKLFRNNLDSGIEPRFEIQSTRIAHGIMQSNLWISATDVNSHLKVAGDLLGGDYESGSDFYSGTINPTFSSNRPSLIKITRNEIEQHKKDFNKAGYLVPSSIENWPGMADSTLDEFSNLAPFIDINGNGCYEPQNGDYPFIKGDQAIYIIYNDLAKNHASSGAAPLSVEVHAMIYAWNLPNDSALNSTVFVDYTIKNRSEVDLKSVKVGHFTEYSLGCRNDDFIGCDTLANLVYTYNRDGFDEDCNGLFGFGRNPPAVGLAYISHKLSSFMTIEANNSVRGWPKNGVEFDNYLNARWRDSTPLTVGGTGFSTDPSLERTNYMFTGDPINEKGWTESSAGNTGGSRRSITSIPEFDLPSFGEFSLTVAYGFGVNVIDSTNHLMNINLLKLNMEQAKAFLTSQKFDNQVVGSDKCAPKNVEHFRLPENQVSLFPNPSISRINIESIEAIQLVSIYSLNGQKILTVEQKMPVKELELNLEVVPEGLYLLKYVLINGTTGTLKLIKSNK
ncbi:MAG: T9SS type A sorting domain-containing protein [Flavobacteriales bacterium]|nr:T9SS type A sorting domain-containing protein [Flavobacteriales bacterium]